MSKQQTPRDIVERGLFKKAPSLTIFDVLGLKLLYELADMLGKVCRAEFYRFMGARYTVTKSLSKFILRRLKERGLIELHFNDGKKAPFIKIKKEV